MRRIKQGMPIRHSLTIAAVGEQQVCQKVRLELAGGDTEPAGDIVEGAKVIVDQTLAG